MASATSGNKGANKIFLEDTSETLTLKNWTDGQYILRSGNELISGTVEDMGDFKGGFGSLKTAAAQRQFENKHVGEVSLKVWDLATTGTASITYNNVESTADFNVPIGDTARMQSRQYITYQAARTQEHIFTGVLLDGATVANGAIVRYGVFDEASEKVPVSNEDRGGDGHYFKFDNTGLSVVERRTTSSGSFQSETTVAQASFSTDPLDGTGPSGITFSPDNAYIYGIRLAWLGVGEVAMGIFKDGKFYCCHCFDRATLGTTYMKRATLPFRFEVDNSGGSALIQSKQICTESSTIGGFQPISRVFTYTINYSQGSGDTHAFTIRLNSQFNRNTLVFYAFTYSGTNFGTTELVEIKVLRNATPAAALTFVAGPAGSGTEVSTTSTTFTGGVNVVDRIVTPRFTRIDNAPGALPQGIQSQVDGTPETLTFITDEISGTITQAYVTFAFDILN